MDSQDYKWFGKLLASGTLSGEMDTLYKCPKGEQACITTLMYYNTSASPVVCSSYYSKGVPLQFHTTPSIPANFRHIVNDISSPISLDQDDSIQGKATIGKVVNFFIWGNTRLRQLG